MILAAIYKSLMADDTITGLVAEYRGKPAIFTFDVAPKDCGFPLVMIDLMGGISGQGTGDERGLTQICVVRMYDNKHESSDRLETLAWAAWARLERGEDDLESDDFEFVQAACEPPMVSPDPDGFPGLRLSVSLSLLRKEV